MVGIGLAIQFNINKVTGISKGWSARGPHWHRVLERRGSGDCNRETSVIIGSVGTRRPCDRYRLRIVQGVRGVRYGKRGVARMIERSKQDRHAGAADAQRSAQILIRPGDNCAVLLISR